MDTLYFGTRDLNSHYTLELGLEGKADEPRKKITTKVLPRYLPIFNKVASVFDLNFVRKLVRFENTVSVQSKVIFSRVCLSTGGEGFGFPACKTGHITRGKGVCIRKRAVRILLECFLVV